MNKGSPIYPRHRLHTLEPYYSMHVSAMTEIPGKQEGLNAKADIAEQLAWRDQKIARLQEEIGLMAHSVVIPPQSEASVDPYLQALSDVQSAMIAYGSHNFYTGRLLERLRGERVAAVRASDHLLTCTGSNEPGQPGSVYVAIPEPITPPESADSSGEALRLGRCNCGAAFCLLCRGQEPWDRQPMPLDELARPVAVRNDDCMGDPETPAKAPREIKVGSTVRLLATGSVGKVDEITTDPKPGSPFAAYPIHVRWDLRTPRCGFLENHYSREQLEWLSDPEPPAERPVLVRCKCGHDHQPTISKCGYVDYDEDECRCVRLDPVVVGSKWRFQQHSPEAVVAVLALRRIGACLHLHVAYEVTGAKIGNGLFVVSNGSFPSGFVWASDPTAATDRLAK